MQTDSVYSCTSKKISCNGQASCPGEGGIQHKLLLFVPLACVRLYLQCTHLPTYWLSLRSWWLGIGQVLFFAFLVTETKSSLIKMHKKKQGQYPAIMNQTLKGSIRDLLYDRPVQEILSRWGCLSKHRICFILPSRRFSHCNKQVYIHWNFYGGILLQLGCYIFIPVYNQNAYSSVVLSLKKYSKYSFSVGNVLAFW